jgi:hypothetical protein
LSSLHASATLFAANILIDGGGVVAHLDTGAVVRIDRIQ